LEEYFNFLWFQPFVSNGGKYLLNKTEATTVCKIAGTAGHY